MKITIHIPISPFIKHWSLYVAYLLNELAHWGMSKHAPMYSDYVIRKNDLQRRMIKL